MKGIPQGRYTKEFREEAVKMVMDGGISLPEERKWWRRRESNPGHCGYEPHALTD